MSRTCMLSCSLKILSLISPIFSWPCFLRRPQGNWDIIHVHLKKKGVSFNKKAKKIYWKSNEKFVRTLLSRLKYSHHVRLSRLEYSHRVRLTLISWVWTSNQSCVTLKRPKKILHYDKQALICAFQNLASQCQDFLWRFTIMISSHENLQ